MVLFLIGAGFNIDAGSHRTSRGHEIRYPLINDVARLCFDLEPSNIPQGKSIEDLFADAQDRSSSEPMKRLTDILMDADHFIAGSLAQSGAPTCYSRLFDRFVGSHYLTFNYDSLLEILLLQRKQWFPDDGFGVPVQTELTADSIQPPDRHSTSKVLHLHGSLCLNFTEFDIQGNPAEDLAWLDPLAPTQFMFDPGCLTSDFSPYARFRVGLQYITADNRVIAPVPNKGPLLVQGFTRAMYESARRLIMQSETLISVGYSFNHHDRDSFDPILRVLDESQDRMLILVSPDAKESAERIVRRLPRLHVKAIAKTLKEWATTGFFY